MSKKLLEESTIRSFMKLANLQPLTAKFLKEASEEEGKLEEEDTKEEGLEEELQEEGDDLEEEVQEEAETVQESAHVVYGHDEDAKSRGVPQDRQNPTSGGGGGHKKAPAKKAKPAKMGKMDAAKNAPGDAKLKPMKQTHVHSDKPDSIEHNHKSNAPKKNNSTFEVMTESLEEMDMEDEAGEAPDMGAPEGGAEMGSAGEAPEHKEKMKELIRTMLTNLSDMGKEYGLEMDINDQGAEGTPEAPEGEMAPPEGEEDQEEQEDEAVMQEKLDEMVEKLTKRVAARLVKESKKKR